MVDPDSLAAGTTAPPAPPAPDLRREEERNGRATEGGEQRPAPGRTLETELAEVRSVAAELDDRWRRAVAELDNFRKRTAREAGRQREDERANVAALWLPVIDNLELALEHATGDRDSLVEGVRAVRDQAVTIMASLGYPRGDDLGDPFDPQLHEAVGTIVDASVAPGTVVHVVRPRYGVAGRVLRPAAVVVAAEER